ncbi:hypothetical protein DC083_04495 [Ignatzschineria ureiclastica]|uniref:Rad50/SbcC-type AAA domain-containing protein n=1 Tax=Ignatzschineria ureiclastica TaxID=472582 RepID=A0A2U2AEU5_9GAMM|nr:SMC family ATPase [Ignatzschineria ureiclastica]PWD81157.1 hypothetical protein DC083_04495 [Ignatzschineria ureiclastica]GGZ96711.1 nuclease SbcCD subunit C [Ignatzschineria ureiclastica]
MRPIQLTLTAFGPYQGTEVIDFRKLAPHDLFVISGKTGAGKTSIFDGISYALFGEASGADRKDATLSLRSDFASDQEPTTAELIFELRGKQYRIFRQLPYLKSGNKTLTQGKAEIYALNDTETQNDLFAETPLVERQIPNIVNAKIEALLGLNRDQFNQLVMLPQGEYQRFLTSKTADKEAILRTVFNTEKYQNVVENLKLSVDQSQKTVIQLQAHYRSLIQAIYRQLPVRESPFFQLFQEDAELQINSYQAIQGLEIENRFYQEQVEAIANDITTQKQTLDAQKQVLLKSKNINEKFQSFATAQQYLETLNTQQAEINRLKNEISLAEKALSMEKFAHDVFRLRQEKEENENHLSTAKQTLTEAQKNHQQAVEQYQEMQEKEAEILALSEEITLLESRKREVETLADLQSTVINTQKMSEQLQQKMTNLQQEIATKLSEKKRLQNNIREAETISHPIAIYQQLQSYLEQLTKLYSKQAEQKQVLITINEQKQQKSLILQAAKEARESAAINFYQQQAVNLAHTLKEHEPCPVCGSLDHPQKAKDPHLQIEDDRTPNPQADFDNANEALNQAQREYDQATHSAQEILTHIESLEQEIYQGWQTVDHLANREAQYIAPLTLELDMETITDSVIQANIDKVVSAFKKGQASWQLLQTLRPELNEIEHLITQQQTELEALKESYQIENTRLVEAQSALTQILQHIPKHLQDSNSYQAHLSAQKSRLTALKSHLQKAEKERQEAEQKRALAFQSVEQYQAQEAKLITALEKAEHTFHEALINASWTTEYCETATENRGNQSADETQFLQAQLLIPKLSENRQVVETFTQRYLIAQEKVNTLTLELKDQNPQDTVELEQKVEEQETILEAKQRTLVTHQQYIQLITQTITSIKEQAHALESARSIHEKTVEVYNLVRGQNRHRISLERFILIEYFELIIHAANIRLQQMTNGQFQFIRSEEIAARNVQSGLDLNVYDAYTGENRDVKTLSGGEKFKASLSLSLGMADVIQSHKGGISIETLFIDEGFGALDEESLLQAIDVLIELQASGRMIGVISHVEELKQTLPARIEVTKTKSGYSKTAIMHS